MNSIFGFDKVTVALLCIAVIGGAVELARRWKRQSD